MIDPAVANDSRASVTTERRIGLRMSLMIGRVVRVVQQLDGLKWQP